MSYPILEKGDRGTFVVTLQNYLNKFNFPVACDGQFGNETDWAVKKFQTEMGLVSDGIVGPITWAKLDLATAELENRDRSRPYVGFLEAVIRNAESLVGHKETRPNSSLVIDRMLKECGVSPGNPWCMAFVQWCFAESARRSHFEDPLKPDTAGVLDLWNRVPMSWKHAASAGRRGDIIIFDHGKGTGHTGIVTGYESGYYLTIEGNTNDEGGREGNCVAEKRRAKYNNPRLRGFIRVPDPGAGVVS